MIFRFNPFMVVRHNQYDWPRIAHHAVHIAIGLPAYALGRFAGWPLSAVVCIAAAFACVDKLVWFDWHRTSGRLLHWSRYRFADPADFVSDLGLTLLGAIVPAPWFFIPIYYALSIINGT